MGYKYPASLTHIWHIGWINHIPLFVYTQYECSSLSEGLWMCRSICEAPLQIVEEATIHFFLHIFGYYGNSFQQCLSVWACTVNFLCISPNTPDEMLVGLRVVVTNSALSSICVKMCVIWTVFFAKGAQCKEVCLLWWDIVATLNGNAKLILGIVFGYCQFLWSVSLVWLYS